MRQTLLLVFTICWYQLLNAQQINVKGGFVEDTLKIGEPVHFYLTAAYPKTFEVIFPDDSTYDFQPYEDVVKTFFPASVDSVVVVDSAIYELVSFEIDTWQKLKLPVFLITTGDSVSIFSNEDSVRLYEMAPQVTDTVSLKSNLAYNEVDTELNLPLIYGIVFGVVGLLLLAMVIFGKQISTYFKTKRLKREYNKFSQQFEGIISQLKVDNSPQNAEFGVTLWKKYLEKLDKQPYTKLTTKELLNRWDLHSLADSLRNIDRSVYGRMALENIHRDFERLEDYTLDKYRDKLNQIKNG